MHGISSHGFNILPQTVQWLRPLTTLSPFGSLHTATFRKLAIQAPKKNLSTHMILSKKINIL